MTSAGATGIAYLVGAGPGDPGLLTARALELIADADAILYDRLIPTTALSTARPDALLEFVGKGPAGDSVTQDGTTARLVELALAGNKVVRLKGGDPFVFGRGGEEAAALAAAGIAFEIVPGVTAGIAAPAYAGIPVTHRDNASAVAFVTGHEDPTKPGTAIDWPALANFPGTLVFYMGVKSLPRIAEQLIAGGRAASELVAVIEQGTTSRQHTVTGTLATIAEIARDAGIKPPALTVVGDVVGVRDEIEWFEKRPLYGRSVVVTRARAQAGKLATKLRSLGATVIETPAIKTVPRNDDEIAQTIAQINVYDLICLTSVNGVEFLFAALRAAGKDARALGGAQIAAIGPATADALERHGVIADFVPERSIAESLLELLVDQDLAGRNVLIAAAADARRTLPDGLADQMAVVDELALYDTVVEPLSDDAVSAVAAAELITFASASAVDSLIEAIAGNYLIQPPKQLVSIGPVTSAALRAHELEPTAEAEQHDIDGLVAVVLKLAAQATSVTNP